jgi:hypothetical protein
MDALGLIQNCVCQCNWWTISVAPAVNEIRTPQLSNP